MIESPAPPVTLRFGSWWGHLAFDHPEYLEAVRLVFGAELYPPLPPGGPTPQFECRILGPEHGDPAHGAQVPPGGMLLEENGSLRTITTEVLHVELRLDSTPTPLRIWIRPTEIPAGRLHFHISVIFHKVLFLMDRIVLHGAAVRWEDSINLFIGEKGAGKSTICLALARRGATVLGEDRLVLRKSEGKFLVSGGDERSRVTERTEQHFFDQPLAAPSRDFAGTLKKEIRLGDYFRSQPFQDFPPGRLFFPRITGRLRSAPLKSQPALLKLMGHTAIFHYFAGPLDQQRFFDFLADFIATIPAFVVELSHNLEELERLGEHLRVA
jgi:hypothetical protein